MTQQLIDTVIQLKQCGRCKGYVFFCQVSGVKTAVDVGPLDVVKYRQAIIDGRATYDVMTQAGRPWKLKMRLPSSQWPPYAGRSVVAEHPCTKAMNMAGVELLDPPGQPRANAIVQHGVTQGSSVSQRWGKSFQAEAVPTVTRHRSKREFIRSRCARCSKQIGDDYRYVGVQYQSRWQWIQHDFDCLENPDDLVPNSQCRCGVRTHEIEGVSLDLAPVDDEDGITTYSIFATRLKLRDETWKHPSVTHEESSKHRGWSGWNPTSPAYRVHVCR